MSEEFQIYRCTECGKVSVSLGWLHGHIEKHRGYFGWIQVPFTKTAPANVDELMKRTEVLTVTDYEIEPALEAEIENGGETLIER